MPDRHEVVKHIAHAFQRRLNRTTPVRLGSVRAATEELGVSDAGMSMHVAALRKELDAPLCSSPSNPLAGVERASWAGNSLKSRPHRTAETAGAQSIC
jgi:hypothetical protein